MVHTMLAQAIPQRAPRDAQLPRGLRHVIFRTLHGGLNHAPLRIFQRQLLHPPGATGLGPFDLAKTPQRNRQSVYAQQIALGQHHRMLHRIFQLAHVARPIITL